MEYVSAIHIVTVIIQGANYVVRYRNYDDGNTCRVFSSTNVTLLRCAVLVMNKSVLDLKYTLFHSKYTVIIISAIITIGEKDVMRR